MYHGLVFLLLLLLTALWLLPGASSYMPPPQTGNASITYYSLGNHTGACDCKTGANIFPVAAINQLAFGCYKHFVASTSSIGFVMTMLI